MKTVSFPNRLAHADVAGNRHFPEGFDEARKYPSVLEGRKAGRLSEHAFHFNLATSILVLGHGFPTQRHRGPLLEPSVTTRPRAHIVRPGRVQSLVTACR